MLQHIYDIGKPVVKKKRINKGILERTESGEPYHIFTSHEIVGEEMVRGMEPELFFRYGLNQDRIARLVGVHGLPIQGIFAMRDAKNFDKFQKEYAKFEQLVNESGVPKKDLMNLFMADTFGHLTSTHPDLDELTGLKNALLYKRSNLREIYNIQQKTDYSDRKVSPK